MKVAEYLEIKKYKENNKFYVGNKELEIFAVIKTDITDSSCKELVRVINDRFETNCYNEKNVKQQIFDDKIFVFEDGIIICY